MILVIAPLVSRSLGSNSFYFKKKNFPQFAREAFSLEMTEYHSKASNTIKYLFILVFLTLIQYAIILKTSNR